MVHLAFIIDGKSFLIHFLRGKEPLPKVDGGNVGHADFVIASATFGDESTGEFLEARLGEGGGIASCLEQLRVEAQLGDEDGRARLTPRRRLDGDRRL